MHARKTGIARRLVPLVLLFTFTCVASLYPQFLEDEEEKAPDDVARSIKAEPSPLAPDGTCVINVSWQLNPNFTGSDYIIARSGSVIDTVEKVRVARVIATVKGAEKNVFGDRECAQGSSFYYVVLSKNSVVGNRMGLVADGNYTVSPAVVGEPKKAEELIVAGIKAEQVEALKARVSWLRPDKTGVYYYVYRSDGPIDSAANLKKANKLGTVTDAGEFIDESVKKPGDYYYAVTARQMMGRENRSLVADSNYTSSALSLRLKAPEPEPAPVAQEQVAVTSIEAGAGGGAVTVRWTYTGKGEGVRFRLFRTWRVLKSAGEVREGHILTEVDLSAREYRDPISLPGKYYYGLIPAGVIIAGNVEKGDVELVPGVTITRVPVMIQDEPKIEIGETEDIDRILKRTFFRGKYRSAAKELYRFVKNTDNKGATAKAKLFIGRSFIELGEYRKALDYLFSADVKKYFPKQAAFWQEFALTRLRNY